MSDRGVLYTVMTGFAFAIVACIVMLFISIKHENALKASKQAPASMSRPLVRM